MKRIKIQYGLMLPHIPYVCLYLDMHSDVFFHSWAKFWISKIKPLCPIPPDNLSDGLILNNFLVTVDLLKFFFLFLFSLIYSSEDEF